MSDVIALDQPTSLFPPRKATRMSPLFSAKYGVCCHFNIHTCHQLKFDLGRSLTRYPSGLHKNRYVVEDSSR